MTYPLGDADAYARWAKTYDTLDDGQRAEIEAAVTRLPSRLLFSLVLPPCWEAPEALIASLIQQPYPYWELWLEAGFADPEADSRLRAYDPAPGGPAAAFNVVLQQVRGEFVVPVTADRVLAEQALFELAAAARDAPKAELVYGDEDRLDALGGRCDPWFKTGWDPELILGRDAIGHPAAYRTEALRQRGGLDASVRDFDLALYELSLRTVSEGNAGTVVHVPAVLCHRTGDVGWDAQGARRIVRRHLDRAGQGAARVSPAPLAPQWTRIQRPPPDPAPLVSVIVPTRDGADLLARCTEGLLTGTDYPAIELLIVDNDSEKAETHELFERLSLDPRVRVLPHPGPFNFSALNNRAAEAAGGEVLLLLNNDTEVQEAGWLSELVSHAVRPEVGAVGAKLLYGDGRVQHAGVVLGPGYEISHQLRLSERDDPGPHGLLALTRCVSAVTGACLAVRRKVYFEVGGLDEENHGVAYNDVDFCLKLGAHGYRVVWTPFAVLSHLESVSRGTDHAPEKHARLVRERDHLLRTWDFVIDTDPYHNPNLVYGWEAATLAAPPRRTPPWRRRPAAF